MKPKTNPNPISFSAREMQGYRPVVRVTVSCSRTRNIAEVAFPIPANGDVLDDDARDELFQKIGAACAKIGILPAPITFAPDEEMQNGEEESAAG